MAKIALVGDSHFDQHSRLDECIRVHDWIARDAERRGVELVLHSGDVYERKSTPVEREAVAAWVQRVAQFADVVIVRGNHDAVGDLPLLERLATPPVGPFRRINVVEGAGCLHFDSCSVLCIAWPRVGELRAREPDADPAEALRNLFRGLALSERFGRPRLALMHAMVRGSRVSTGQPLMGCDLEIGLDDLALLDADAYLLGHIHRAQDWLIADSPCIYPGSPRRTAFGETEAKGYVVIDTDGGGLSWEFVETPCAPMVMLEGSWRDGQLLGLEHGPLAGADVRLRYAVPFDHRVAAAEQAEAWRARIMKVGAASCKVEAVVTVETRARTPEVARAVGIDAQLSEYWESTGFKDESGRRALLEKLAEVTAS